MRPARTSSMAGWYSSRQASAKAGASIAWPCGLRIRSASRAMPVRQSTSVPNTSKNSAFTEKVIERPSGGGLHAFLLDHRRGRRTREKLYQRLGGFVVLGRSADAGRIDRVVLDLGRQRPDQRRALHRHDLADLVNAELGLALGNMLGDRATRNELGLRLHLGRKAEPLEHARNIDAARAAARRVDIGDRLRVEHGAFERLDRADVRPGRARLDDDADPDLGQDDAACRGEFPLLREIIDSRRAPKGDIEG